MQSLRFENKERLRLRVAVAQRVRVVSETRGGRQKKMFASFAACRFRFLVPGQRPKPRPSSPRSK
eukprot:scaffold8804_cov20-Tisochrysis_lutea.AAC.1